MAVLLLLCLATSIQIGAAYVMVLALASSANGWISGTGWKSIAPFAVLMIATIVLVGMVYLGFPRLWAGFLEHARQTPSFTGLRRPAIGDWLKVFRTIPGILMAGAFWVWAWRKYGRSAILGDAVPGGSSFDRCGVVLLLAATLVAIAFTLAALLVITPNAVLFMTYLQPLVVAGAIAGGVGDRSLFPKPEKRTLVVFVLLALLVSIRAVGLTTWGILCAKDVSYSRSLRMVREQLQLAPAGSSVVLSSAYLYETSRDSTHRIVHSDWMMAADRNQQNADWEALLKLQPSRVVLTPFDYYRRYQSVFAQLSGHPEIGVAEIRHSAGVRPPDSFPKLNRVLQHVSWAPVVISIEWRRGIPPGSTGP
jgi:hypothetical protein